MRASEGEAEPQDHGREKKQSANYVDGISIKGNEANACEAGVSSKDEGTVRTRDSRHANTGRSNQDV